MPIDAIAGTSAGALVGAFFLAGRLDLIEALTRQLDWRKTARLLLDVGLPRGGLLSGRNMERLLQDLLPVRHVEALDRPFAAVATDLRTHQEVVIRSGDLIPAIRASLSIPGIFTPVERNGRLLVDGALVNPLPVSVVRDLGADFVIAVDVNLRQGQGQVRTKPDPSSRLSGDHAQSPANLVKRLRQYIPALPEPPAALENLFKKWQPRRHALTIFDVLTQSTRIFENQITRNRLATDPPDILIQPAVGDLFTLDFPRASAAIAAGVDATREQHAQLEALFSRLGRDAGAEDDG